MTKLFANWVKSLLTKDDVAVSQALVILGEKKSESKHSIYNFKTYQIKVMIS